MVDGRDHIVLVRPGVEGQSRSLASYRTGFVHRADGVEEKQHVFRAHLPQTLLGRRGADARLNDLVTPLDLFPHVLGNFGVVRQGFYEVVRVALVDEFFTLLPNLYVLYIGQGFVEVFNQSS